MIIANIAEFRQAGVTKMLRLIEADMRVAMSLTGIRPISDINKTILAGRE